jgi:prepilin-type N-terminal cleavage/methylation domain-containing protein
MQPALLTPGVHPAPGSSTLTGVLAISGQRAPRAQSGVTLVETMVALTIFAMFMAGFVGTFMQSRRLTESSVLHAACTSVVYGIIEQIKQLDYSDSLPSLVADPTDPNGTTPPFVRVRVNQSSIVFLKVKYTPAPTSGDPTPQAPTTTPGPTETAADVIGAAFDNSINGIAMSTITGTTSQTLNLQLWIWIDEIPKLTDDVSEVKKVTIVYTYSYIDGSRTRTIRNREVFLRTRYDR